MKTYDSKFQLLLEHISALHKSEKEMSGIFEALLNTSEAYLKEGIIREAQENKKHCIRLEGLLKVLQQNPCKNCQNETSWKVFINQFSSTLKRVVLRHASFGYKTAIMAAIAFGQNEIANFSDI